MDFRAIFSSFSRRNKPVEPFVYEVPETLRNKVLLLCQDVFAGNRRSFGGEDHRGEFWDEIHQTLLYRHGRLRLSEGSFAHSRMEDAVGFLLSCNDEEFLDFVEYIFRVKCLFHVITDENALVAELNELFASESAGYELTEIVKQEVVEPVSEYPFLGHGGKVIKTLAYPQVIRKDNQVTHAFVVKPALQLLADPAYDTANQEFLEALEDYKSSDYGDCLTKCGSAFESVMKIICARKRWPYSQTDTAGQLISLVIKNSGLDSYFEQPLMLVATLRNRMSKSHGAGVQPKMVSQNLARYALSSTAAAITFLVNETK